METVIVDGAGPPGCPPAWASRSVLRQLLDRLAGGARPVVVSTEPGLRAQLRAHGYEVTVVAAGDAPGETLSARPLAADEALLVLTVSTPTPNGWAGISRAGHRLELPAAALDPGVRALRTGQRLWVLTRAGRVVDAWL